MALTKPPVLPAWAEAGDRVQPSNAEIQAGWPLSNVPPSRQRFNWLLNYLANGIRYFSRRGLPDYDAAETYMIGDRIIGDDGKTYRSLIDNNIGQTPSAQPTKWEEWAPSLSRLADLLQKQTYTAFTTAGAAPNFTLTPTPAITAYAQGQRFRVKFHAAGSGADVLNVSGQGNKSLKQYDRTGAKVAAVIAENQLTDVEYDGVDLVIIDPLPPADNSGHGQCRLNHVSAVQIRLDPFNGNRLMIGGSSRAIPAAGVTLANAGMAANTTYFIYAYWTGAAIALEFSATTYATDAATGVKVKNGDSGRTLVGIVRTDGAGQFVNSASKQFVGSYFNDSRVVEGILPSQTTPSGSFAECAGFTRAEFVLFSGQSLHWTSMAYGSNSANGYDWGMASGYDSTSVATGFIPIFESSGSGYSDEDSLAMSHTLIAQTDGYHYLTGLAKGDSVGTTIIYSYRIVGVIKS